AGFRRAFSLAAAWPYRPGTASGGAWRPAYSGTTGSGRLRYVFAPPQTRYARSPVTALARAIWTQVSTPIFLLAPFMNPDTYCQEKAARSGSSFYYAFLFLPPDRRKAITALYAFCREVDDIVDEC